MNIESTLTKKQYIKLNLTVIIHRFSFYFAVAVFFVFLIYGLFFKSYVIIIALIYFAFIIIAYATSITYMTISKKNKNFFLKKQFKLSDEGIVIQTPVSEETVKWEAFIKWRKMAEFYMIYLSSVTFLIIPESDIPVKEIAAFRDLISRKIGGA